MPSVAITADYRPIRVGWCVRGGSLDNVRAAMRLSTMLWGGRFNPIIVVDNPQNAEHLCDLFHVDVLYPVESDAVIQAFIAERPYIGWPKFAGPFFLPASPISGDLPRTALLDVGFAIEARARDRQGSALAGLLVTDAGATPLWSNDDPIADVLLATYGEYPDDDSGDPLRDRFAAVHGRDRRQLQVGEPLPESMLRQQSPLELTTYGLWAPPNGATVGEVFVGSASSFNDIVFYWNLSAANHDLIFYDPAHHERFDELTRHYVDRVEEAVRRLAPGDWRATLGVWLQPSASRPKLLHTSIRTVQRTITDTLWNGLNDRPPRVATEHTSAVASIAQGTRRPSMTFQLGLPEVFQNAHREQQLVIATVRPFYTGAEVDGFTFAPPNIPELNDYYSQELFFNAAYARVEPDGLGIITRLQRPLFNIRALATGDLFQRLFETYGMSAKPSRPGTIARRLIQQMGGLQSCRIFKIAGVRRLIERFPAEKAFSHRQAMQQLGQGFSPYRTLYIRSREKPYLEPNDVFLYLLDKQVFRAGLTLRCPACELDFWVVLDNAATYMDCEYCGARFNSTTQLRDRDAWMYRRSGLFGRDDHQEGAIPVTLVLQRLDTSVNDLFRPNLFTTALDIRPQAANVPACEIDFVFLAHDATGRPQLIMGEAKNQKEIEIGDVRSLTAIAAAFPKQRIDVFPTFAKLTGFTQDELGRCLEQDGTHSLRHILLSPAELEPYDLHDRFEPLETHLGHVGDVERLAEATQRIYRNQIATMRSLMPPEE